MTTQGDFLITKWLRNIVILINSVAVTNNELEAPETLKIHLGYVLFLSSVAIGIRVVFISIVADIYMLC